MNLHQSITAAATFAALFIFSFGFFIYSLVVSKFRKRKLQQLEWSIEKASKMDVTDSVPYLHVLYDSLNSDSLRKCVGLGYANILARTLLNSEYVLTSRVQFLYAFLSIFPSRYIAVDAYLAFADIIEADPNKSVLRAKYFYSIVYDLRNPNQGFMQDDVGYDAVSEKYTQILNKIVMRQLEDVSLESAKDFTAEVFNMLYIDNEVRNFANIVQTAVKAQLGLRATDFLACRVQEKIASTAS